MMRRRVKNNKPQPNKSIEISANDICTLETHESHYKLEDDDDNNSAHLEASIDAPDFTVLHVPQSSCNVFDESTEVLMMQSESNAARQSHAGTDSDVEVLLSEEIMESDWSADADAPVLEAFDMQLLQNCEDIVPTTYVKATGKSMPTTASASVQQEDSTDQDISIEELSSHNSMASYEQLDRKQLLKVAREQAMKIERMENDLRRYREAQQKLLEHVNAMHAELAAISDKAELEKSLKTIN